MKRQIIIGDIHGCIDELRDLLSAVAPTADDEIIATGDLVNRGPDNEAVLRLFRDSPSFRSVRGNVEHNHALIPGGRFAPTRAYQLTRDQLGSRYERWLGFMAALPLCIELPQAIVLHGAFEPQVTLRDQREDVLLGQPHAEAELKAQYKRPWYELYDGAVPVVVGHHDYQCDNQPLIRDGRVYAIDTGCVRGGRLTALVLPDFRIVSVPARDTYWPKAGTS